MSKNTKVPYDVNSKPSIRAHLKTLLYHWAAKSENPGRDLQVIVHELIAELHVEVQEAIKAKRHLRSVGDSSSDLQ